MRRQTASSRISSSMERIAILDHDNHTLFIEDIPDEMLDSPEWDGEESYILNNYDIERFSWEFITDAYYYPEGYHSPIMMH